MHTRPAKEDDLRVPLFEPLFAELDKASHTKSDILKKLLTTATVRVCDKGAPVLFEDDPGDFLLIMLRGRVKVVLELDASREPLILAIVRRRGAVFGEIAAMDSAKRSASVLTIEESEFLRIPSTTFREAACQNPRVMMNVVNHLGRIVRDTNERLRTITMYDAYGQTLRSLYLFSQNRDERPSEIVLTGCPQILQIAQMLGRWRETISNALGALEKSGHIKAIRHGHTLQQVTITRKGVNKYLKGLHPPFA